MNTNIRFQHRWSGTDPNSIGTEQVQQHQVSIHEL